jgi:hypothetical protein
MVTKRQLCMVRARALFYFASSTGKEVVAVSRANVSRMLELEAWHEVYDVAAALPDDIKVKATASGLVLTMKQAASTGSEDVRRVFEYWRSRTGRGQRVRLTSKRRRHINARLKTFSAEELCRAVDGLMRSDWHTGQNPSGVTYTEISHVFGNEERTERFLQQPDKRPDLIDDRLSDTEREMAQRRNRRRVRNT